MKKFLIAFLFLTLLSGCEIRNPSVSTNNDVTDKTIAFNVKEVYSAGEITFPIREFTYKGHTYIYCHVRDGIAMTHAGHCSCNKK